MATLAQGLFNQRAVIEWALSMIDVDNAEQLLAPLQPPAAPPQPDPIALKELAIKEKAVDVKALEVATKARNQSKDRESKQNIEVLKLASSLAVHPESDQIVDGQIRQLAPLMSNIKPQLPGAPPGPPPAQPMSPRPPQPIPIPMGLGGLGRPPLRFAPPPPRRVPFQPQGFGQ